MFDDGDHPVTLLDTFDDWDYEDLMAEYVYYADGLFVVYSISDRKSFDALESIIGDALSLRGGKNTIMILVGNKNDLGEERQVTTEEGKAFADKKGIEFFEVSAKTRDRVDEMVQALIEKVEEGGQKKQNSNGEVSGVEGGKCLVQ